jgi:hypothetical protein
MEEKKVTAGTPELLEDMLGSPINIDDVASETDINNLEALVFDLYKEAISLLYVTSHLVDEFAATKNGLSRNQGICVGLIVRMTKFMIVVAQLSAEDDRREVVLALSLHYGICYQS